MTLKNGFGKCYFVICFISQWMKRSKHGLFVFPPKKTLIWRRHRSIDQSCCSMTSKYRLISRKFSGMKFFHLSFRLTNQKPRAFVSVLSFVCCFSFVCSFSFQGHTKVALFKGDFQFCWHCSLEQGNKGGLVAQHSPCTNLSQGVQIPAWTPFVCWVCWWFSPLLRDVFLRLLWFSLFSKIQRSQIPILPGKDRRRTTTWMCYFYNGY